VVRLVVEFQSEPEVVAAIIGAVAMIVAALIGGIFMVRSARIQASSQLRPLPAPAPKRRQRRRGRRSTKQTRPPPERAEPPTAS
jgi:hypothetical protein